MIAETRSPQLEPQARPLPAGDTLSPAGTPGPSPSSWRHAVPSWRHAVPSWNPRPVPFQLETCCPQLEPQARPLPAGDMLSPAGTPGPSPSSWRHAVPSWNPRPVPFQLETRCPQLEPQARPLPGAQPIVSHISCRG